MMSGTSVDLEERLHRFVEHHVIHGERLAVADLCADRPDLAPALQQLVDRYLAITRSLEANPDFRVKGDFRPNGVFRLKAEATGQNLPSFDGFQTIERLGAGGMGEVQAGRTSRSTGSSPARSSAATAGRPPRSFSAKRARWLFSDRRIVRIFEHAPAILL